MSRYTSPSSLGSYSRSPSPAYPRRSRSAQSAPHRRHRSPSPSNGKTHEEKKKTALKASMVFLGAVGAASLAAHKYWPKGMLYGEKENWDRDAKEKKTRRADRHGEVEGVRRHRSAHGPDRHRDYDRYSDGPHRRRDRLEWEEGIVESRPAGGHRGYTDGGRGRTYIDDRDDRRHYHDNDPRNLRFTERQAMRPRRYLPDEGGSLDGRSVRYAAPDNDGYF